MLIKLESIIFVVSSDSCPGEKINRINKHKEISRRSLSERKKRTRNSSWQPSRILSLTPRMNSQPRIVLSAWKLSNLGSSSKEFQHADTSSILNAAPNGLIARRMRTSKDAPSAIFCWKQKRWSQPSKRINKIKNNLYLLRSKGRRVLASLAKLIQLKQQLKWRWVESAVPQSTQLALAMPQILYKALAKACRQIINQKQKSVGLRIKSLHLRSMIVRARMNGRWSPETKGIGVIHNQGDEISMS